MWVCTFGCHPALDLVRLRTPAPSRALISREPSQQLLEELPSSSNAPGSVLPPSRASWIPNQHSNPAGAWLLPIPDGLGRMGREGRAATAAGSIWPSWPSLALGLAVCWESLARVSLFRSSVCISTGTQLPAWFPSTAPPNPNGDSFFAADCLLLSSLALLSN